MGDLVAWIRGLNLRPTSGVLVLTGAGMSAESGIETFRDPDGWWKKYDPADLATYRAFRKDPKLVWEWYDYRRSRIVEAPLHDGQHLLAYWESVLPGFHLVTQNVDGLHQRAGNGRITELHGNLWQTRCISCRHCALNMEAPLKTLPPICDDCGGLMRPDVVWFGESLPQECLQRAFKMAERSRLLIVVGTSSMVYPAAELPMHGLRAGAVILEINPQPTPLTARAQWSLQATASVGLTEVNAAFRSLAIL